MSFFFEHWLEFAVVANSGLLIYLVAEGRGIPERLAYLGRRIDKLDRALRDGRLVRGHDIAADSVRLLPDMTAAAPELAPPEPARYRQLRAAGR